MTDLEQRLAEAASYSRELMDGFKACQRHFIIVSKLVVQNPAIFAALPPDTAEQVVWAAMCDVPVEGGDE